MSDALRARDRCVVLAMRRPDSAQGAPPCPWAKLGKGTVFIDLVDGERNVVVVASSGAEVFRAPLSACDKWGVRNTGVEPYVQFRHGQGWIIMHPLGRDGEALKSLLREAIGGRWAAGDAGEDRPAARPHTAEPLPAHGYDKLPEVAAWLDREIRGLLDNGSSGLDPHSMRTGELIEQADLLLRWHRSFMERGYWVQCRHVSDIVRRFFVLNDCRLTEWLTRPERVEQVIGAMQYDFVHGDVMHRPVLKQRREAYKADQLVPGPCLDAALYAWRMIYLRDEVLGSSADLGRISEVCMSWMAHRTAAHMPDHLGVQVTRALQAVLSTEERTKTLFAACRLQQGPSRLANVRLLAHCVGTMCCPGAEGKDPELVWRLARCGALQALASLLNSTDPRERACADDMLRSIVFEVLGDGASSRIVPLVKQLTDGGLLRKVVEFSVAAPTTIASTHWRDLLIGTDIKRQDGSDGGADSCLLLSIPATQLFSYALRAVPVANSLLDPLVYNRFAEPPGPVPPQKQWLLDDPERADNALYNSAHLLGRFFGRSRSSTSKALEGGRDPPDSYSGWRAAESWAVKHMLAVRITTLLAAPRREGVVHLSAALFISGLLRARTPELQEEVVRSGLIARLGPVVFRWGGMACSAVLNGLSDALCDANTWTETLRRAFRAAYGSMARARHFRGSELANRLARELGLPTETVQEPQPKRPRI
eukprot:TRINITY_DN46874_c0_g1_i1.p1 TRINITY_DN46874_c0_g1~~TRINITY_DN46874_c0_g1_i1.p1  ORF type:complete len:707 (+),score=155.71 TRINITY_DN46874_c0_g1_i1:97-2217(+)